MLCSCACCPALAGSFLRWSDSLLMLFSLCHLSLAQTHNVLRLWSLVYCTGIELTQEGAFKVIKGLALSRWGQSSSVPATQQWIWFVRNSAGQGFLVCRVSTVLGGNGRRIWLWVCLVHLNAGIRPADSVSWQKKTAELAAGRFC